jgi:hypothetical protein
VNKPELETVPPVADHVTAVFVEPETLAVNCRVLPVTREAEVGLIDTETGGGCDVTVIVAAADFVLSATLVAVTV